MISLLLIIPVIAVVCSLLFNVLAMSYLQLIFSTTMLVTAFLSIKTGQNFLCTNLLYLDSINSIVLITATFLDFFVALYSAGYVRSELQRGMTKKKYKYYYFWKNLFILSMMISILASNLGIYWIGLEATTLATTFLVAFYGNKTALESAWKYIIMCSVGIALGLFAIIILYFTTSQIYGSDLNALSFYHILPYAKQLNPQLLMLAFIMALIGFGTKAGLAPMHYWLPDAHSQSPSPISSLLSGILLNTALLGIFRFYELCKMAGLEMAGQYLVYIGIFTVVFATISIIRQSEFKRLFAYSSMENIGIITLGVGLGGPAIIGSFLHIMYHAIAKGVLFFGAGNLVTKLHEYDMGKIRGLFTKMPKTSAILLLGVVAICGLPPFALFTSKIFIIMQAFKTNMLVAIVLLVCIFVVSGSILSQIYSMLVGEGEKLQDLSLIHI